MATEDVRSVGELLLDADWITRDILLDLTGEHAPAMLRTWGEVVEAAAQLWSTIPQPSVAASQPGTSGDPMVRLVQVAHGIHRTQLDQGWPGPGPADERLLAVAETFDRATDLIERNGPRHSPAVNADISEDIAAARMRIMHTLYVGAHGVGVAMQEHVKDLRARASAERFDTTKRGPWGSSRRSDMIARLDAFEQLAGGYVNGRFTQAAHGELVPPSPEDNRLQNALTAWDIQAHRTLAAQATSPNLLLVARTQAAIATTAVVVLNSAASTGQIDPRGYRERLSPAIDASQEAWTRAASRWAALVSPARTDVSLGAAAKEVYAAARGIAHDKTTWATPQVMASRVDLAEIAHSLQQALTAAVDVAHVTREVAATNEDLTGPARVLSRLAHTEAEAAVERGERTSKDIMWVTPATIRSNQLISLPDPVRAALVDASNAVITTATRAMSASGVLDQKVAVGDVAAACPACGATPAPTSSGRTAQDRLPKPETSMHSALRR